DPPRVARGAADDILRTLEACGMQWDGAIVCQSTRFDAYHAALHRLRQRGVIYPCACSRREIADSALAGIEGPVYPGTCRSGVAAGKTAHALRVDTRGVSITFDDAVQGPVRQNLETEVGDFVLYRADQVFAYQLAVVIDYAGQGITDIVRGADLLHSTPRQIYLQQLLGFPTPRYAHVAVAVNAQGEKLSKQTHAPAIDAAAPLPALIAALHFLGQQPPHELSGRSGTRSDAALSSLWHWAIANWHIERVPPKIRDSWFVIGDW
ncbi:MAG: tRNA glutamyl-Q(34) synthetase GluQRS, partial [Pseudomonadota bacterium]